MFMEVAPIYYEASVPHQRQEFIQVIEVTVFVGVNKDQINGSGQLGHFLMSIAFNLGDQVIDARSFKIFPRMLGTLEIDFKGGEFAAGHLQRQSEPDAGITVGGSELDHMLGVDRFCQQAQKPGILHRHGQTRSLIAIQVVEHGKDLFLGCGLAQRWPVCDGSHGAALPSRLRVNGEV
jgi:hypothetical protein